MPHLVPPVVGAPDDRNSARSRALGTPELVGSIIAAVLALAAPLSPADAPDPMHLSENQRRFDDVVAREVRERRLGQLAHVARLWRAEAEQMLWRDVVLVFTGSSDDSPLCQTTARKLAILTSTSAECTCLNALVRSATVIVPKHSTYGIAAADALAGRGVQGYPATLHAVEALAGLPHLECVRITTYIDVRSVDERLAAAFAALGRTVRHVQLRVDYLRVAACLVCDAPRLESLDISTRRRDPHAASTPVFAPPALRRLIIRWPDTQDAPSLLLQHTAPRLTSLALHHGSVVAVRKALGGQPLSALRRLSVGILCDAGGLRDGRVDSALGALPVPAARLEVSLYLREDLGSCAQPAQAVLLRFAEQWRGAPEVHLGIYDPQNLAPPPRWLAAFFAPVVRADAEAGRRVSYDRPAADQCISGSVISPPGGYLHDGDAEADAAYLAM